MAIIIEQSDSAIPATWKEQCLIIATNNPYAPATIKSDLSKEWTKDHLLILAIDSNEVLGFLCARAVFEDVDLDYIAVAENHKNKGVGKKLMAYLIKWATEKACHRVLLEVGDKNKVARIFYEKMNFAHIGLRKKYYNNSEDAHVMELHLTNPKIALEE